MSYVLVTCFVLLVIASTICTIQSKTLKKQKEKIRELEEELFALQLQIQQIAEVYENAKETKSKYKTGNDSADFDASLGVLRDISKSTKTKSS